MKTDGSDDSGADSFVIQKIPNFEEIAANKMTQKVRKAIQIDPKSIASCTCVTHPCLESCLCAATRFECTDQCPCNAKTNKCNNRKFENFKECETVPYTRFSAGAKGYGIKATDIIGKGIIINYPSRNI